MVGTGTDLTTFGFFACGRVGCNAPSVSAAVLAPWLLFFFFEAGFSINETQACTPLPRPAFGKSLLLCAARAVLSDALLSVVMFAACLRPGGGCCGVPAAALAAFDACCARNSAVLNLLTAFPMLHKRAEIVTDFCCTTLCLSDLGDSVLPELPVVRLHEK